MSHSVLRDNSQETLDERAKRAREMFSPYVVVDNNIEVRFDRLTLDAYVQETLAY